MPETYRTATGWVGWVVFAGMMMLMIGLFQAIEGLIALLDPGYYLAAPDGVVLGVDLTTWGWLHLVLGVIATVTGIGLLAGNPVARVAAVVLALASAVLNLAFLGAYPVWSAIVVVVNVIVIYAIIVHGREVRYQ